MELTVDGCQVFIATGGKPFDLGKPTLVMVHGAGMDHTVWSMQARYFAYHGFSVMNLDLRGHGRSDGDPPTSIPTYADWLVSVVEAAGVQDLHLMGHSMGSLIALEFAARSGRLVKKLALLGIIPHIRVHPDLLDAAQRNEHAAFEGVVGWGVGRRAQIGGHRAPGSWITGTSMRLLEASWPGVLANDFSACDVWDKGLEVAEQIDCPTLLLLGADDRMTPPRSAKKLADAISDSRTVILRGAGHMMMTEQPEESLNALAHFFGGADP